ncbi:MAG: hypothetical protein EOO47_23640, partial [Flavobacterium sp.]
MSNLSIYFNSSRKQIGTVLVSTLLSASLYAQKTDKFMGEIVNYDETTVPKYTLPALLQTAKGEKVKNVATWEKKRRPEVLS